MNPTIRHCFSCDLKDDQALIATYKEYHRQGNVWPEIIDSIKKSGIVDMEIYLIGNRMFMIMEVDDTYDPELKSKSDSNNPKVQEWETLMWKFQQKLPWAKNDEKWMPLEKIFKL